MINAVYGYEFKYGVNALFSLEENNRRRYPLTEPVSVDVFTDRGTLHAITDVGFVFDGRSGPKLADYIVPNLGSLGERTAFYLHDCCAYAQSLSFAETNLLLKCFLRDMCGYSKFRSELVRIAVSISNGWYGYPEPDDEWYCNVGKVETSFYEI